jgi:CheY-like chemotaxis protein
MTRADELEIVLVEDSEADALLVRRALADEGLPHRLTIFREGVGALAHLAALADGGRSMPDLVLLDLEMPGIGGAEVLGRVKGDERLRAVPVVILSASSREADVLGAYQAGANSFLCKAPDYERFRLQIRALHLYWAEAAERPPRQRPRNGSSTFQEAAEPG